MALYKYQEHLTVSEDDGFDRIHGASTSTPHSGIYRCDGCGVEIASKFGDPLPPRNHHPHNDSQGPIQWRLIVLAE